MSPNGKELSFDTQLTRVNKCLRYINTYNSNCVNLKLVARIISYKLRYLIAKQVKVKWVAIIF